MKCFRISMISCTGLAALVMLGTLVTAAYAQTITTFDVPNSTGTAPQAINISGQITGFYYDANGAHSFVRQQDGTLTTFDVQLDGLFWPTSASDINVSGEIVGTFFYGMATRGFLRKTDGTIVPFRAGDEALSLSIATSEPAPRFECPDGTAAVAINAKGQITGAFGQGCLYGFLRPKIGTTIFFQVGQGFVGSQQTSPQAISSRAEITGYYREPEDYKPHGFVRKPDGSLVRFDVPNSDGTSPQAINPSGGIAGYYQDANLVSHGFLREPDGTFVTFDPTGSIGTQVTAINRKGAITGFYATADGIYHGFLRTPNGNIEVFDAPGANGGTFPKGINDRGQITGYYQDAAFVLHGFVRSAR